VRLGTGPGGLRVAGLVRLRVGWAGRGLQPLQTAAARAPSDTRIARLLANQLIRNLPDQFACACRVLSYTR
jgi:hypothetical protein